MAQYPSVVVTNKGHDLISAANATNKAVTYIKAVVGDGQLNNQSIESLTAMISPKLELPLSTGVDFGDGQWRVSFALSNSTLTNGFYAREVGVFAKLDGQDDSTAILFGYTNGGNYVDYIPPKTTPIDSQVFNCDFVIGDAENVTVNILDGTFATHQALTNAIDIHNVDETAHQPIIDLINNNQTAVNNKIALHNTDATAHNDIRQMFNNVVTDIRLGSPVEFQIWRSSGFNGVGGHVITALINKTSDDFVDNGYARPLQKCINNNWYTVESI